MDSSTIIRDGDIIRRYCCSNCSYLQGYRILLQHPGVVEHTINILRMRHLWQVRGCRRFGAWCGTWISKICLWCAFQFDAAKVENCIAAIAYDAKRVIQRYGLVASVTWRRFE